MELETELVRRSADGALHAQAATVLQSALLENVLEDYQPEVLQVSSSTQLSGSPGLNHWQGGMPAASLQEGIPACDSESEGTTAALDTT